MRPLCSCRLVLIWRNLGFRWFLGHDWNEHRCYLFSSFSLPQKDKEGTFKKSSGRLNISATLTCTRLCCWREVEGYSEQLGSGYKWGRSISKGGKGCHLTVSMIDVGTAVCSSTHAEPSPTVAAATGRKRKWVDLGVIVTKCLTTVAKHSGFGSGSYAWT